MRILVCLLYCAALCGCATLRHPASAVQRPWDLRILELQSPRSWQLDGRAAVAVGSQGWQANIDWRQNRAETQLHLSGPLGIGAVTLNKTAEGLSLNGAPASAGVVAELQEKLGFDLPVDKLRYWLVGVPDPADASEVTRNAQDRAQILTQGGWTMNYDRYLPVGNDILPSRLVLSRDNVRVRIAVDHWEPPS